MHALLDLFKTHLNHKVLPDCMEEYIPPSGGHILLGRADGCFRDIKKEY
jgi:hypothetical protein